MIGQIEGFGVVKNLAILGVEAFGINNCNIEFATRRDIKVSAHLRVPTKNRFGGWGVTFVFVCLAIWLICLLFATSDVLKTPYFGAFFSANNGSAGVVVTSVAPGGPADRAGLKVDQHIISIQSVETGTGITLSDGAAVHDRSEVNTYARWDRVVADRQLTWELIATGDVALGHADGTTTILQDLKTRTFYQLPLGFWLGAIESFIVLAIVVGIAVFAPPSSAIKYLFVSGVSLSTNMLMHALRVCEELVQPPALTFFTYLASNLSAVMFSYGLLALLWHTPKPLSRFPFGGAAICFAIFAFATQHFQWFSFPLHPYQFPYMLAIIISIGLTSQKWISSRGNPIDRAALLWVLLSILAGVLPWFFLFSLPISLGGEPIVPPALAGQSLIVIYIGFALGALKYRLFGMRTIWLQTLTWLIVGIGFVLVDFVLLFNLNWSQDRALPTTLLLMSWAYFPLKSFMHNKIANRDAISIEETTKQLFLRLTSVLNPAELDGRFMGFLREFFEAKEVELRSGNTSAKAKIEDNGLALSVPSICKSNAYVFSGSHEGRRLFSVQSRETANILWELASGIYQQKCQEFENAEKSRAQILRDLHDDVGAKLLDLIYTAPPDANDTRATARQALKALKDSLLTIEDDDGLDLEANWMDFWHDQEERLKTVGFTVEFSNDFRSSRRIGARDLVNMKRIVEEHVSNVLKYSGKTAPVIGSVALRTTGEMELELTNTIQSKANKELSSGRGFINMRARAAETNAVLKLGPSTAKPSLFTLALTLPLGD